MNWDLNFIGPIKPTRILIGNKYIIVTTNYATKWVEVKKTLNQYCSSYNHIPI
jgi:hypothetical protein